MCACQVFAAVTNTHIRIDRVSEREIRKFKFVCAEREEIGRRLQMRHLITAGQFFAHLARDDVAAKEMN